MVIAPLRTHRWIAFSDRTHQHQTTSRSFEPYPGELTIGEVLSNYTQILDQPKHNVTNISIPSVQHWQILLDENGIIGPDGKAIPIKYQVNNSADPNQVNVVFDTGFTYPQVPSYVAKAIYGNLSGASLIQNLTGQGAFWVLPCDQELNVTFVFGGVPFPINPLDLNFDAVKANVTQLVPPGTCLGAFQPISFNSTTDGVVTYDVILGMAFIRNVYLLINFGNFVDGSNRTTAPPYIQTLPITNITPASEQFAQLR